MVTKRIAAPFLSLMVTACLMTFTDLDAMASADAYVGSLQCVGCHAEAYEQWSQSDHFKAMAEANERTVLGDFSEVEVDFHDIRSRFFMRDGDYFVSTVVADAPSGVETEPKGQGVVRGDFLIQYTFGHYPLQQYLIELPNGHIQALSIAWDSRPAGEGGQRWMHLQPDEMITPEHPFFWTRHLQNWNSRCAECHSTRVELGYDAKLRSFDTTWSEINVACEACHGPAKEHLQWAAASPIDVLECTSEGEFNTPAESSGSKGFAIDPTNRNQFVFEPGEGIARNVGGNGQQQIEVCGGCHSRRATLTSPETALDGITGGADAYHDHYGLSLLDQGLYHADGHIQDEVFVLGSFLQSKMHAAGVTCSNCHNPHSGELKVPGNAICAQCHSPAVFDQPEHHHHPMDSDGAQCVNCHMPSNTYMQVDSRRDHAFSIPRPAASNALGAPDACSDCHHNWIDSKVAAQYVRLYGDERKDVYSEINAQARLLNVTQLPAILKLAQEPSVAAVRRATLLAQGVNFPARITLEALQDALYDKDPLVRRAAVDALAFLGPEERFELLDKWIEDPSKVVRMSVARQLIDRAGDFASPNLKPEEQRIEELMREYEASLRGVQYTPSGQMALADYYSRRGAVDRAKQALTEALLIEPNYVPALLNMADFYRLRGAAMQAKGLLDQALLVAPDSAAAQHALGLWLVREKQMPQALRVLEQAARLESSSPRYLYVFAVALESAGESDRAISALIQANESWPYQPDVLFALIGYLEKYERVQELTPFLADLSQIMPGNPQVNDWIRRYIQQ